MWPRSRRLEAVWSLSTYFIPRTVLDCDLFIDVPVMKITGAVGMTWP